MRHFILDIFGYGELLNAGEGVDGMCGESPLIPLSSKGEIVPSPLSKGDLGDFVNFVAPAAILSLLILFILPFSASAKEDTPDIPEWAKSEVYETQQANKEAMPEEGIDLEAADASEGDDAADATDEQSEDDPGKKALPTGGGSKSGVSPQALSLPDGPGSMQGMGASFTPNLNTGSGAFSVPIAIPPGRRGVQPSIGLGYATGGGDGVLGWGWSVGVPFITRQSDKGLPQYNSSDRFIYNGGTELVPIDMPADEKWPTGWENGADGTITYFRSRIENAFMRCFYNKTNDTWLVQDKKGNHYFFGEYQTEKIVGPKGTYQWNLTRMADVRNVLHGTGNDVRFTYLSDGNNLYFSDIYWNSYEHDYGAIEKYQHRLHFRYELRPDPTNSYSAGFKIEQNLRLVAIEVSSFLGKPGGKRTPTRTYLFSYGDPTESYHSRLVRVQMCGRDFQWSDNYDGGTGTCMPPLEFHYTQTQNLNEEPSAPVEGFGAVNELVQTLDVSPDVAIGDPDVSLIDVNQDGLPDVFITRPEDEYFGSEHAAILNDASGNGRLEDIIQVDNPAGWSLRLSNLNVQIMDVDGTGNADLLHMPYAEKYHYYRLTDQCASSEYCWDETEEIPLNPDIDFTNDSSNIQMADLNSDGLIDIIRTTGTRMEHYMNLSATRDPNSKEFMLGQFGSFDANGYGVPNESVNTCVLMRGGPMQFANGTMRMGDMNGDGLIDIVDLKNGSIAYWPNRGYGQWGNTEIDCSEGEYVDGTEVEMTGSPYFSNLDYEGISIADLNGDGLSDLLQIRFDAVDIWLNRGDNTFTPRHIIENTPETPSGTYGQVTLADINGSGTVDIVWGNAGNWQYIDLGGDYRLSRDMTLEVDNQGIRPGMIERVDNGLGGATILQYDVTTHLMMNADMNGNPWDTVLPMPLTVVTKSISRDFMEEIGGVPGRYVSEYLYRNPYYDAHEAEFRGFSYGEKWDRERDADGDGIWDKSTLCSTDGIVKGEAPIVGRNWFHTGTRPECMIRPANNGDHWKNSWGPHSVACAEKLHDDNPLAGLAGSSIKSDVYSPCTEKVTDAMVSELEIRHLFDSNNPNDTRRVYLIIPNQGRLYKYNPDAPQSGGTYDPYVSVKLTGATSATEAYPSIQGDYTPVAALGNYHLIWGSTKVSDHGEPIESFFGGFKRLSDLDTYKYADCDQHTDYFTVSFDPSTWVHYATDSHMVGAVSESGATACDQTCSEATPCRRIHKEYLTDGSGDMRFSQFFSNDVDGSPLTPFVNYNEYNSFGQVVHKYAGCTDAGNLPGSCQRHGQTVYRSAYSAYIAQDIVYKGANPFASSSAEWDAGLGQIQKLTDLNDTESAVEYDALGRFVASYGPILNGENAGKICGEPLKTAEYIYGYHERGIPMSTIITRVNTSQTRCGDNPWSRRPADMDLPPGFVPANSRWEETKTFITSIGQTYATVVSGDDHLGAESSFPFVINGDAELNAKGGAYTAFEGNVLSEMPAVAEDVIGKRGRNNPSTQQFDAYGRPTVSIAPDGTRAMVVYGLDSADTYDHLDLSDDFCHQGTHTTQRVDGLGRTVVAISRYRPGANCGGKLTEKWSVPTFNALGNVIRATQFEREAGTSNVTNRIVRQAQYDQMGRLRFNSALTFGTWEYRYNELGQMEFAQNELGDQFFYDYDELGRLVAESSLNHADPNSTEVLDAVYFYDSYPDSGDDRAHLLDPMTAPGVGFGSYPSEYAKMKGRLVAKWDRSGISVVASDLGLFGESWRMVFPDELKVYHSEGLSDYAGQLVYSQDDRGVRTTASYYEDGTAESSFVSYKLGNTRIADPVTIVKKSYTNILGQTELVEYGDAGNTVAWNGYDPVMHRRMGTVVQQANGDTLMAFGYRYNKLGLLEGVADYRGRDTSGTVANHPKSIGHSAVGYHFTSMASAGLDSSMKAPNVFGSDVHPETGWPIAASPSDAEFFYDGRYQLIGEERDYLTANGDDWTDPTDPDSKRLRSVRWDFDTRGNMTSWTEEGDGDGVATDNLGRALGGTIKNGWQLNMESANPQCMTMLQNPLDTLPVGWRDSCRIPDAIYFASNIGDEGLPEGKGTCIWANYDKMGRMVSQIVRTMCSSCDQNSADSNNTQCSSIEGERLDYTYTWDARSRLIGATKVTGTSGDDDIVMSYLYDIGGNRVIREKSLVNGAPGSEADVYQDVYLGGTERRHVQLTDQNGIARSINTTLGVGEFATFLDNDDTRELHYAAGARLEWKPGNSGAGMSEAPKIFLSFGNHLGSTSAVIDFDTGKLVEWNTNYAYGADESRWKNPDARYADSEEPYGFTGKEEDKAVGLHYFGARYYSSYLGRWLSPDPPVVHGGGLGNHYNYGGNSPYIYVDPDGNVAVLAAMAIGALVGLVVGFVAGGMNVQNGQLTWDWGDAALGGVIGAAAGFICVGAALGGAAAAASLGASAEVAALVGAVTAGLMGGNIAWWSSFANGGKGEDRAKAWGWGFLSGFAGGWSGYGFSEIPKIGWAGQAALGVAGSVATSAIHTAIQASQMEGGIYNEELWQNWALDQAIGAAGSVGGAAMGEGLSRQAGMGGSPRIGGAVGSAGDDAGYTQRGGHFGNSSTGNGGASKPFYGGGQIIFEGPHTGEVVYDTFIAVPGGKNCAGDAFVPKEYGNWVLRLKDGVTQDQFGQEIAQLKGLSGGTFELTDKAYFKMGAQSGDILLQLSEGATPQIPYDDSTSLPAYHFVTATVDKSPAGTNRFVTVLGWEGEVYMSNNSPYAGNRAWDSSSPGKYYNGKAYGNWSTMGSQPGFGSKGYYVWKVW